MPSFVSTIPIPLDNCYLHVLDIDALLIINVRGDSHH